MSVLAKTEPYYKRFINGDKGHSHAALEFGVYAVITSLTGWLLSPALSVGVSIVLYRYGDKLPLPYIGDKYWTDREIAQSRKMKRNPTKLDLLGVPLAPSNFWRPDAIDDVMFPRKMRNKWMIGGVAYSLLMLPIVGILGVLF